MRSLSFKSSSTEQANFVHFVADIAWFGISLAALSRFLSIFAIRVGASTAELSLIAALPGFVLLFSTTASGWWRRRFSGTDKAIRLPSFLFRFVFLLPAFTPFLPEQWQPLWLIISVSLAALPQGISNAIFVIMMRESISQERFTQLNSRRSSVMNLTVAIGALAFGMMLETMPYPHNYQLMFMIAFGFAIMSHWHVTRVHLLYPDVKIEAEQKTTSEGSVWHSRNFLHVALAVFITHVAFFSMIMVTPLKLVNELGAGEGFITTFGFVELFAGAFGASVAVKVIQRLGSDLTIAVSMIAAAAATFIIASATSLAITLPAAFLTGSGWTIATIGVLNLLAERTGTDNKTRTSIAFQQVVAVSIFIGPMIGWLLLDLNLSLSDILIVGTMLRLLAAVLTFVKPIDMKPLYPAYSHSRGRHG